MARSIVVTSGKGGVGKTTLTVNMGRIFASMGLKTVLVDTDMGLNNLDVLTGVENKVLYDIVDVIENRCRVKQALIEDTQASGLFVLPSVHSYDKSRVDSQSVRAVTASLKTRFDYVIIDCPAGIELGFHRAVASADEALVVTTPHLSAIRDADKVIKLIKSYEIKKISVVLNRVRGDKEYSGETITAADVSEMLGVPVAGVVPEDDGINALSSLSEPCKKRSDGYRATELLCRNIHFGGGAIYDAQRKYRGLFGGIKRRMRKIV